MSYHNQHPIENYIGRKFTRLTVLSFAYKAKDRREFWNFKCDCGKVITRSKQNVIRSIQNTRSCGCLRFSHGLSHTPEYRTWMVMMNRCYNPANIGYYLYGGRGIRVCNRWKKSVEKFVKDMGKKPSPKHTIDRIDTNGDYRPSNCRWVTQAVQNRNTRTNRMITFQGITLCVTDWAKKIGISYPALWHRLKRMSLNDALTKKPYQR